ncbi:MAG: triose-phosphate isomerase [Thermoguttaceae bacterium]
MRRPFIAGNWKMNLDRASAVALAEGLVGETARIGEVDVAVCPPYVYLDAVAAVVAGSKVELGAQDMYHESGGAFTGEISAAMLCDLGCKYVILGHSERRHVLGESDEAINRKVHVALAAGLTPIVCVGEMLDEREANRTAEVVRTQFDGSLAGVSDEQMRKIVIAYEPVWAIGTGKVATPQQAEEVHLDLRKLVEDRYNGEVAGSVRIQYGGSVKPGNAADLLGQPNIDGALVGGAALRVDSFMGIIAGAGR